VPLVVWIWIVKRLETQETSPAALEPSGA